MEVLESINMEEILADPTIGIVPALLFIGMLLKHSTNLNNQYIPWILTAIGILAGLVFIGFSAVGILSGLLYAALTILTHGLLKPVEHKVEKKV